MNIIGFPGGKLPTTPSMSNNVYNPAPGFGSENTWNDPTSSYEGYKPVFNSGGTATTGFTGGQFDGIGEGIPIITNNKPGRQNEPVTATLSIGALNDNSQTNYAQGDALFIKYSGNKKSINQQAYALPNLNYNLEAAHVMKKTKELQGRAEDIIMEQQSNQNLMKRKFENTTYESRQLKSLEMFPSTVDEFEENMNFYGIIDTVVNKGRERDFTVRVSGEAVLPNIFGNVKVGASVGFLVTYIQNPYFSMLNTDGTTSGQRTPGSIPQIIGVTNPEGKYPLYNSGGKKGPNGGNNTFIPGICSDISHIIEKRIVAHAYQYDANGKLTEKKSSTIPRQLFTTTLYDNGIYIHLGTVKVAQLAPNENEIKMSLRCFSSYQKLRGTHPVKIDLDRKIQHLIW
jgi:hypothetical protein